MATFSDQVLDSLLRVLQLDHDKRSRLFALAGAPDPAITTERGGVTPQMRAMPVKLNPYRACVQGGKYDYWHSELPAVCCSPI